MIYFDNAASTKPSDKVVKKVIDVMTCYGNPSSLHGMGVDARCEIVNAKRIIADKLNCETNEVYFTSGATMSNNVFIRGFLSANPKARLIISTIEHDDIMLFADYLDSIHGGNWVYRIGVDRDGLIDMDELLDTLTLLSDETVLVCIQWANGECGVIQDIEKISKIVHSFDNAYLYTDATQYVPYFKVDISNLGIDGLGMSGQKIRCIKGTGLMYVKQGTPMNSIIFGKQGLIGGTENVVGIAALGAAFEELDYENTELYKTRNTLIDELKDYGTLIGAVDRRLPNNVYMHFDNYTGNGDYFIATLDQFGICASSGSACSSGGDEPSHVVTAMGYSPEVASSCIRFTLSKDNTIEEVHEVVSIVKGILTNNVMEG